MPAYTGVVKGGNSSRCLDAILCEIYREPRLPDADGDNRQEFYFIDVVLMVLYEHASYPCTKHYKTRKACFMKPCVSMFHAGTKACERAAANCTRCGGYVCWCISPIDACNYACATCMY